MLRSESSKIINVPKKKCEKRLAEIKDEVKKWENKYSGWKAKNIGDTVQ